MGIERSGDIRKIVTVSSGKNPNDAEAILEEGGLQIWGDVKFQADAVLHGAIRGNVDGTEKIIVAGTTKISGAVRGSDVRVEGEVGGGVTASGQVWIAAKGKVRGRCQARAVRIEPGAEFRGELQVGSP